jgi:uncharacterized membrane protein
MNLPRLQGGVREVVQAILLMTIVSFGFYAVGVILNHSLEYSYLVWNLVLAWVPLVLSWPWLHVVQKAGWLSWGSMALAVLWLGFLPNSFYVVTDFVHLQEIRRVDLLYDVAMFSAFVATSLALGFLSVYIVHQRLMLRLKARESHLAIAGVLLVCSFAIYLGRNLRWNTWDVLVNPAGILFDVSDRIVNPGEHPSTFTTTLTFFVLLGMMYIAVRKFAAARNLKQRK